ncbi:MAG: Gfa-like protein [Devosia sp.]|nr:Gfa-like protein [Devosia sp.]
MVQREFGGWNVPKLPEFPVEGGCLCGVVRYELTAGPLGVYNCHCKDCQRLTGSAYGMSMPMPKSSLKHLSGALRRVEKIADSGRKAVMVSCAACGSFLWNEPVSTPETIVLKPGSLDDGSWVIPIGNIWTDRAAPGVHIDVALVNILGQPADRQPLYDAWTKHLNQGNQPWTVLRKSR